MFRQGRRQGLPRAVLSYSDLPIPELPEARCDRFAPHLRGVLPSTVEPSRLLSDLVLNGLCHRAGGPMTRRITAMNNLGNDTIEARIRICSAAAIQRPQPNFFHCRFVRSSTATTSAAQR
jgi:hypothetical protein